MISKVNIINDLTFLGKIFHQASDNEGKGTGPELDIFNDAKEKSFLNNPWFIPSFVKFTFSAWAYALKAGKVEKWLADYGLKDDQGKKPRTVGIIMAGNIPMVGFHDLLCVLASGNRALVRLSSSDEILIPEILRVLYVINPEYKDRVKFTEGPLKNFDAIIATGSNNSSRYFDFYFGKYPHIIRKNRNGVAVLTDNETDHEMEMLADDLFMYFGLGCRNVSKLYIPEGFNIEKLYPHFGKYKFFSDHHKYRNNYDYQKSILLINKIPHHDNGYLLIKQDQTLISPIAVIHTETYQSIHALREHLSGLKDRLQCVIACSADFEGGIKPGRSQFPELWDYADGVNTMDFLTSL